LDFKLPSRNRQERVQTALIASCAILAAFVASCYEDLPPVEQPIEVEEISLSFNVANDGLVMLDESSAPLGSIGALDIRVTNLYSEYLADSGQVEVEIAMYVKGLPEKSAVVTMTQDDLWSSGVLANGMIAIAPHQQLRIMKQWPHRTEQGDPFADYTDVPNGVEVVAQTGKIFLAFPVHMMVKASVKIFKNRPTEYYPANRNTYWEYVLNYTRP